MFGVGLPELVVILVIALIVLGPKRLPEAARTLGKALGEFRRQSSDILQEFQHEARLEETRQFRQTPPSPRAAVPGAVAKGTERPPDAEPPREPHVDGSGGPAPAPTAAGDAGVQRPSGRG